MADVIETSVSSISAATLTKNGSVTVEHAEKLPFKIYYEIHGKGPNKILLIMGG